jgi:calmodulin
LLISIGQIFDENELEELYGELQEPDNSGMRSDNLFILVSKKIRENDREEQLIEGTLFFDTS